MSTRKNLDRGARQQEAIEAIRKFEVELVDWNWHDLARALGISVQHARNVMEALTLKGTLQYATCTVRKRRLALVDESAAKAA